MGGRQDSSQNGRTCFYCGANVSKGNVGDHTPIPKRNGGTMTVTCCQSCHDMKDRYPLGEWPVEWIAVVIADYEKMSRETKIFLAKAVAAFSDVTKRINERKAQ